MVYGLVDLFTPSLRRTHANYFQISNQKKYQILNENKLESSSLFDKLVLVALTHYLSTFIGKRWLLQILQLTLVSSRIKSKILSLQGVATGVFTAEMTKPPLVFLPSAMLHWFILI
jgi:hypothetical protein